MSFAIILLIAVVLPITTSFTVFLAGYPLKHLFNVSKETHLYASGMFGIVVMLNVLFVGIMQGGF